MEAPLQQVHMLAPRQQIIPHGLRLLMAERRNCPSGPGSSGLGLASDQPCLDFGFSLLSLEEGCLAVNLRASLLCLLWWAVRLCLQQLPSPGCLCSGLQPQEGWPDAPEGAACPAGERRGRWRAGMLSGCHPMKTSKKGTEALCCCLHPAVIWGTPC